MKDILKKILNGIAGNAAKDAGFDKAYNPTRRSGKSTDLNEVSAIQDKSKTVKNIVKKVAKKKQTHKHEDLKKHLQNR